MEKINVTKTFLPPIAEYEVYLNQVWKNNWLTNNGPFVRELEAQLEAYLGVSKLLLVSNGTIAIQLALRALEITGDVITTPFSYCATTTSLLWENCTPIFVDINEDDFNINADLIEAAITPNTTAILATHVFGRPCAIEKIEAIAQKHNLKVIYDSAHCFDATLNGRSLLDFGDIATCSFHATKVFHTIEGGCVVCHDEETYKKLDKLRSFGHINDTYYLAGINGKLSEFHAIMGLTNLPHVKTNIQKRKAVFAAYDSLLDWTKLRKPTTPFQHFEYNYAYYPVVFENEDILENVRKALSVEDIIPRRYFYPSLNLLPYLDKLDRKDSCPVSETISVAILSLPLSHDLPQNDIERIAKIINQNL